MSGPGGPPKRTTKSLASGKAKEPDLERERELQWELEEPGAGLSSRAWWSGPGGGPAPPPPPLPQQQQQQQAGPGMGEVGKYAPYHPYDRVGYPAPVPVSGETVYIAGGGVEGAAAWETVWDEEGEEEEEVKARVCLHLGTFVYPNLPFPYFFDVGLGTGGENVKERDGQKAGQSERSGRSIEDKVTMNTPGAMDVDVPASAPKEEAKEMELGRMNEAGDDERSNERKKAQSNPTTPQLRETVHEKQKSKTPKPDDTTTAVVLANANVNVSPSLEAYTVDTETRATIIIPNAHIPLERPKRPRIWGGGLLPRLVPRPHPNAQRKRPLLLDAPPSDQPPRGRGRRRRRVYTDDSDVFLCAVHAGWVTWSGAARARHEGKEIKVDVRVLRCVGAEGAGEAIEVFRGKEEVVGRFLGGWGEKWVGPEGGEVVRPDGDVDMRVPGDGEEDDGRGLVSAGWGAGHDGSAIEIVNVQFVEKASSTALRGLRSRSQRLWEYHERRLHVVGPPSPYERPITTRLAGRKRRRHWDWPMHHPRRLPNASVLDMIVEQPEVDMNAAMYHGDFDEVAQMSIQTVIFGLGPAGDVQAGFKYDPSVLREILFPALPIAFVHPPPRKRRRLDEGDAEMAMDIDGDSMSYIRPVILETAKESYLLSPNGRGVIRTYDISLILDDEIEEVEGNSIVIESAPDAPLLQNPTTDDATLDIPPAPPPIPEPISSDPSPSHPGSFTAVTTELDSHTANPPTNPHSIPLTETTSQPSPSNDPTPDSPKNLEISKSPENADATSSMDANAAIADDAPITTPVSPAAVAIEVIEDRPKQLLLQTLQRNLGMEMFRFTKEGVNVADGLSEETSARTEWVVKVKRWKWGPDGQEVI